MAFKGSRVRIPSPPNQTASGGLFLFLPNRGARAGFGAIVKVMSSTFDTSENLFVSEDETAAPDFTDLFDEPGAEGESGSSESKDTESFAKIETVTEEIKPYFTNANFYQDVLTGEGEVAKRLHAALAKFLKAENPEDRSLFRQRLIPIYWEVAKSIARKTAGDMPVPKQLLLRFGILLPTLLDKQQRRMFGEIIEHNATGQPIYYVDEWLNMVAHGRVNASATDETKPLKGAQSSKVGRQLESARGKVDAQMELIRTQNREMSDVESSLLNLVKELSAREQRADAENERGPHNDSQRSLFSDVNSELRRLSNMSRNLAKAFNDLAKYRDAVNDLRAEAERLGEDVSETVDTGAAADEMGTIQQMVKLTVGRQGNHFPIFSKQYFRGGLIGVAVRENVNNTLAEVERLDPSVFIRTFKQKQTRIVPNVILVPCYGDAGICWEPFERFNRATSRGRLAIPLYPKDLRTAVIAAVGDLRWQVAKERAAHYWMEEGLTGWYYQWFSEEKLKGDVKDKFIEDYVLWILKESEGQQKLERPIRDIFWRYMPFPQNVKDELKNRGFVYAELIKKDANRAMSDGY